MVVIVVGGQVSDEVYKIGQEDYFSPFLEATSCFLHPLPSAIIIFTTITYCALRVAVRSVSQQPSLYLWIREAFRLSIRNKTHTSWNLGSVVPPLKIVVDVVEYNQSSNASNDDSKFKRVDISLGRPAHRLLTLYRLIFMLESKIQGAEYFTTIRLTIQSKPILLQYFPPLPFEKDLLCSG